MRRRRDLGVAPRGADADVLRGDLVERLGRLDGVRAAGDEAHDVLALGARARPPRDDVRASHPPLFASAKSRRSVFTLTSSSRATHLYVTGLPSSRTAASSFCMCSAVVIVGDSARRCGFGRGVLGVSESEIQIFNAIRQPVCGSVIQV